MKARSKQTKGQAIAAILKIRSDNERFKGEPEKAFIEYLELLGTLGVGDPDVQYYMARHYVDGNKDLGIPEDRVRATPWLQKAVAQGHSASMCMLGLHYLYGDEAGLVANPEEGMRLLLSAEKLDDVIAPFFLAVEMRAGKRTPTNDQGAARWFRQTAERKVCDEVLGWKSFRPLRGREYNAKFYLYHEYMLQGAHSKIATLLQQHQEDVMAEILFDLERSLHSKNDSLYVCMQNLIAVIRFTTGTDLDYFNQMLDSFYQNWVLNVKMGDVLSVKGMNIFFERLQELDLKTIPTDKIISLIESTIDTWNRVVSANDARNPDYDQIVESCTNVIVSCLPTLLYRLQVEQIVLDDALSKLCAIILCKSALGNGDFLSAKSITCQDLMMILSIMKNDRISPENKVTYINLVCEQTVVLSGERTSVADQGMFTAREDRSKGKGEAVTPSCGQ